MKQDKKDFIEAMLTWFRSWFRSPQVGNDEEIDREFLSDAYDSITCPHWISVEDELPPRFVLDPNDSLFVLTYGLHTKVAFYKYDKGEWVGNTEVTHWMPLPQAPSSSEKPNNCEKGGNQ